MKIKLLILFLLVPCSLLFPWAKGGHKLIGYIAGEYLTDTACTNIYKLIKSHLNSDSKLSMKQKVKLWIKNHAPDADSIRNKYRNTAPWHFIDLPEDKNYTRKDILAYLPANNDNVISQLSNEIVFLINNKNTKSPIAYTNLLFLIHFAGDITQPLHNIDLNGDRGGNGRIFTNLFNTYRGKNKYINLHILWDLEANTNDITAINKKGKELVSKINLTPLKEKVNWTNSSLIDWSYKSYLIGIQIYNYFSITNGKKSYLTMVNFSDYKKKNEKTAYLQIEKGGLRLAYLLNTIYGK